MDTTLTQLINGLSGQMSPFDSLMVLASAYGVPAMVIAVILMWWTKSDQTMTRHACLVAGFSFVFALGINQIILLFVHRIRPYDAGVSHLLVAPSADWSFPSDHATAVSAIVASFWLRARNRAATLLSLPALLIAFSRVFIGIHYVGDIVGGVVTGLIGAVLVNLLLRPNHRLSRMLVGLF